MKWFRFCLALTILLIGPGLWVAPAAAQDTQNFSLDSFTADYYLSRAADRSSKLEVKEELVARFPDFDQNHGILRAIPKVYDGHDVKLQIISVADESGKPYRYDSYTENNYLVLKIGNPDTFVRGQKTYIIRYQLQDVAKFYPGHDEFFWDINGDQWYQPFGQVVARIHLPKDLQERLNQDPVCFSGYSGSREQNCTIEPSREAGSELITAAAQNLKRNQTLSIAIGFKPQTFTKSQQLQRQELVQKLSLGSGAALALVLPIAALWFMFRRWRQFGDDPKGRGVIIPQYEQPKGLDVLTSDYLYKQSLRPTAISAMLIELAVKGYVTIYEIPKPGLFGKKDYELELKKSPTDQPELVKQALSTIFPALTASTRVKLSDFKKSAAAKMMYEDMKKLEHNLAESLHSQGYFIKNPKTVKRGYQIWSGVIMALAIGLGLVFSAIMSFVILGAAIGAGLAGAVVFFFSHLMPARTKAGVEAYDQVLGLEDYIELAEAERLRYLQSPEGAEKIANVEQFNPKTPQTKVKLFEKLLPYSMLFGLEKQWAKQFEGLYAKPPDWYHGNWTAFNAGYLASSVSDFNTAGGISFASPSSSGSGFSGGGSGGGGGGGGGGGW